jgi:NAD(P)-dependent dehydrogenase (short-subunit alcohol dehydrogenase family)
MNLAEAKKVAEEIREMGHRSIALAVDVRFSAQVDAMVERLVDEMGGIDVLVNCAGTARRNPVEEMTDEDWDISLDVNLRGTFLCCRAAGRSMLERGGGSIINISSAAGLIGIPNVANYCAGKAGVIGLTRTLAIEWADRGIRVNAIAPSHFRTPFHEANLKDSQKVKMLESQVPLGRFGEPEEIVGPAVFLASESSSMVTGHVLAVDGGMTVK